MLRPAHSTVGNETRRRTMKHKFFGMFFILLIAMIFNNAFSQTKCLWFDKTANGMMTNKVGVSAELVKFFCHPGGKLDLNGVKLSYDSLLAIYENDLTVFVKDKDGKSETKIYRGKFKEEMNESTARHNSFIIESTENGEEMKVTKIKVKSLTSIAMVLAMIGSGDFDEDVDNLESALERGGIFYAHDFEKDSRLWVYVN
jgi:hypothetical protein